ncbi:hypothetical protein AURDEDRAFT_129084 [Auricularia subglabra TFB-10046 SS5]|nr:hypothetical protein AURDEDRAFT_129084 [Auricularia subglabra TFB-10046 SS5]
MLRDILVLSILECLPLRDLRRAAAVSRLFYAEAWRAGLYIHRTIRFACGYTIDDSLAVYNELLEHALRKDLRLGITLRWVDTRGLPMMRAHDQALPFDALRAITHSLPSLVVLRVILPAHCLEDLCLTLSHPAPRLRFFEIKPPVYQSFDSSVFSTGLFGGSAPLLRHLRACRTIVGSEPIAAFANVVRLDTSHGKNLSAAPLGDVLPKLSMACIDLEDGKGVFLDSDLVGLSLKRLAIINCAYFTGAPKLRLADVPVLDVSVSTTRFEWCDPPGWRQDCDGLNISISYTNSTAKRHEGITLYVSPQHNAWQRVYVSHWVMLNNRLPLSDLPGVLCCLKYLRLHSEILLGLLQCAAEFCVLRDIRVDVPGGDPKRTVPVRLCGRWLARSVLEDEHRACVGRMRCPALECLSLYALQPPGDQTLRIDLQDVGFVCRALAPPARPALELYGAIVEDAVPARSQRRSYTPYTLQAMFSSVRCFPCTGFAAYTADAECIWDADLGPLENRLPRVENIS